MDLINILRVLFISAGLILILMGFKMLYIYQKKKDKSKVYMSTVFIFWGLTGIFSIFNVEFRLGDFVLNNPDIYNLTTRICYTLITAAGIGLILFIKEILFNKTNNLIISYIVLLLIAWVLLLLAPITFPERPGLDNDLSIPFEYGLPVFLIYLIVYASIGLLFINVGKNLPKNNRIKSYLFGAGFIMLGLGSGLDLTQIINAPIFYRTLYFISLITIYYTLFMKR